MRWSPRNGHGACSLLALFIFPLIGFSQEGAPGQVPVEVPMGQPNPDMTLQQQQAWQEILEIRERLGGGLGEQLQEVLPEESTDHFGQSLKRLLRQPPLRQPPTPAAKLPARSGHTRERNRYTITCRVASDAGPLRSGERIDLVESLGKNSSKAVFSAIEIASVQDAASPTEVPAGGAVHGNDVQLELFLNPEQVQALERKDSSRLWTARRTIFSPPTPLAAGATVPASYPPAQPGMARFTPAWIERLRQAARDLDRVAADLEDLEMYDQADNLRRQAQQLRTEVRRKNDTTDIMQREGFVGERR